MSKHSFLTFSLAILAAGLHAENISLNQAAAWECHAQQLEQYTPEVLRGTGRIVIFSKNIFPYDSEKNYTIKGIFRQLPGSDSNIFRIGVQTLDENKKPLEWVFTHVVKDSDTTLKAPVKQGDRFLLIQDGSKWIKEGRVACNTLLDMSDLPNRMIINQPPAAIENTGDAWKISFASPLKIDLPAGSGVRQHNIGGAYRYAANGTGGQVLSDIPCTLWDLGTRYFRIVILSGTDGIKPGDSTPIFEMRNPSLEIK